MSDNHIMEEISLCYVISILSKAGYNYEFIRKDDGIDMKIIEKRARAKGGSISIGNILYLQLKSTTIAVEKSDIYKYRLRNKNYNDLSQFGEDNFILVVLIMNSNKNLWIEQSIKELKLRKCAFWHYLGGNHIKNNEKSYTTIEISKEKIFNEETLKKLFKLIDHGRDFSGY